MSIDEMIAVIEHHKNGGEVEGRLKGNRDFSLVVKPSFNFDDYDYRIKEKPKTKTVYEWLFLNSNKQWLISVYLYTEEEASAMFVNTKCQKTGRQWEVPND